MWNKKTKRNVHMLSVTANEDIMRHLTAYLVVVAALLVGGGGRAKAEFIFDTAANLGSTANSSDSDTAACLSADGLELYFCSTRPGGYGGYDIWVATRATTDDDWGTPVNLGPIVNGSAWEQARSLSADGLSLFISSDRPGGFGNFDIYVSTRVTKEDNWGTPVNLGATVNSSADELAPCISGDSLQLYFSGYRAAYVRPGGYGKADLWVTTRATVSDPWGTPVNLGATVNSLSLDKAPNISADGLTLFFESDRPGGYGVGDTWVTTRATVSDPWGTPVHLGPTVNSSAWDEYPNISGDGFTLYFASFRPGGSGDFDLWQVPIVPVVDFDGDGIVNFKDFSELGQYWFQDELSVDIAPPPFGDNVVDFKDVGVLCENWLCIAVSLFSDDFESGDFATPIWTIDEGADYPQLWWEIVPVLHSEPEVTLGTSNTFAWDPVPGANDYYAECAEDANFTSVVYNSGWITETSYEFTGLELGQEYWYSVKARNIVGMESDWSNVESSVQVTLADGVEMMLDPSSLKNKNMKKALLNKINVVLEMIGEGLYEEALDKLENDILAKINGCAEIGEPDRNDWIITCEGQSKLYPLIIESIEDVSSLIDSPWNPPWGDEDEWPGGHPCDVFGCVS